MLKSAFENLQLMVLEQTPCEKQLSRALQSAKILRGAADDCYAADTPTMRKQTRCTMQEVEVQKVQRVRCARHQTSSHAWPAF